MRLDVLNEIEIYVRGGEIGIVSKAAIAKIMGCDPRTVKKYIEGYVPKRRRTVKKKSKLDEYKNIIETKMEIGCSSMAIFKYIQKETNIRPENIAVVGDQIFTDVLGGNRSKMFTILVDPIDEKKDYWYTAWKRPIENKVKNKYRTKEEKNKDVY